MFGEPPTYLVSRYTLIFCLILKHFFCVYVYLCFREFFFLVLFRFVSFCFIFCICSKLFHYFHVGRVVFFYTFLLILFVAFAFFCRFCSFFVRYMWCILQGFGWDSVRRSSLVNVSRPGYGRPQLHVVYRGKRGIRCEPRKTGSLLQAVGSRSNARVSLLVPGLRESRFR